MGSEPAVHLDDQLCFALYAASRAMTARYREWLDDLGLTYPQFLVMIVLWEDGPATVGRLGERLRLDSGTLSPLLRRMERNGLVTRQRRIDDERSVEIGLTPAGRAMEERTAGVPAAMCRLIPGVDLEGLIDQLMALEGMLRVS